MEYEKGVAEYYEDFKKYRVIYAVFDKRGVATVIAAACVLFLAGAFPEDAYAEHLDPVSYIDEDGNPTSTDSYTLAGNSGASWSGTVVV